MNGFLNIDKPEGVTSFDVIRSLKKLLPKKHKIGHLGTLDPMATGVLPVAIGQATRIIEFITAETKIYNVELTLGAVSDTEDATGNITATSNCDFTRDQMFNVVNSFIGCIDQIPPMYSAIHHQGKRLYELARQGHTVPREPRRVEIYSIDNIALDFAQELPRLSMTVSCSKGTYIRSLARDIGERLHTGAYLSKLRRVRSGDFCIDNACQLNKIVSQTVKLNEILLPVDYPLTRLKSIQVTHEEAGNIMNGRDLPGLESFIDTMVKIYSPDQSLIAIGEVKQEGNVCMLHPKKVLKDRV